MRRTGGSRERLAAVLGSAFAEGLLSEQTLCHRLDLLYGARLIEPQLLVGDLAPARARGACRRWAQRTAAAGRAAWDALRARRSGPAPLVLALDWHAEDASLVIGRGVGCDVALDDSTVSRRHARLLLRDGRWIVQDLASRNGLTVNGRRVGRCALLRGDTLGLGNAKIELD